MPRILDGIASPRDLKGLDLDALKQLAQEIREEIVATVSRNGGHLGASLGVVELTLALHSVLDAPRDKIIWDVGHQAYPHKLLTGRREAFKTLRQAGGISGFPACPRASTMPSASATPGRPSPLPWDMRCARDRMGGRYAVVTVTGDGALTAGMAFEALNHAGHVGIDLVVIINDNEMSISRNVGALSGVSDAAAHGSDAAPGAGRDRGADQADPGDRRPRGQVGGALEADADQRPRAGRLLRERWASATTVPSTATTSPCCSR